MRDLEGPVDQVDLTPSPQLLEALGDIPYKPWQCLAELIDNSFDDFLSNPDPDPKLVPRVSISLPKATSSVAEVRVVDNGRGMSLEMLQNALRAGYSGKRRYGSLGLFGMGFNIATARLGNVTEVRTTRAGDQSWLVVEIDLRRLARNDSYAAPLRREPKTNPAVHGTEVTVRRLRDDIAEELKRPLRHTAIRKELGRVYSYLLRGDDSIPGFPDGPTSGRGFQLVVNDKSVSARLPCVWAHTRSVTRDGREIPAILPVDIQLTPALACMDCGHWHRADLNVERCAECESEDLQVRERRIHGWFGVQRYLDENDFGIDFLRNGRKIRVNDRSMFSWEHPETGALVPEYPVEVPATQGRIIGEIHMDHVPVGYQKLDFNRESREWRTAVAQLRGEGPMRARKAKQQGYTENNSPLATIFKGYQENRPGTRCLIPGNGEKAIHDSARMWGKHFHNGMAEYMSDDVWFRAVVAHDEAQNGSGTASRRRPASDAKTSKKGRLGLSPLPATSPAEQDDDDEVDTHSESIEVETEQQRFDRYRRGARQLLDLAGEVTLSGRLGRRHVMVYETAQSLRDDRDRPVPSLARLATGSTLEVYVHGEHPVFRLFGRDPRDYALMEIAETLQAADPDGPKATAIAAEVTQQFRDQRVTDSALRDRIEVMLDQIRQLMRLRVAAQDSIEWWDAIPPACQLQAERAAGRADSALDWQEATKTGKFIDYLDAAGVAALVRAAPNRFLDGAVFATTWATWSDPDTRERQVAQVTRPLEILHEFTVEQGRKSRLELSLARTTLDMLDLVVIRLA
ncbi:ATP-binding protein [Streptomyces sp. ME19-03-3]|nr:ATP-binding protein [Streptomyces sp. ME19-03-3]